MAGALTRQQTTNMKTLEVRPCRDYGATGVQECSPAEAQYWGLYERATTEPKTAQWVVDYPTQAQAQAAQQAIPQLRQWCADNYENGADTMVECWSTSDYVQCLARHDNDYDATLKTLKSVASVYLDRQANARNERF